MKKDEYKNLITEMVAKPEKAAETAQTLLSLVEDDAEVFDSLSEKVGQQESKIRDLQDTNTKLFLSITGQSPKEDPEDPLEKMEPKDFAKGLFGGKE